MEISKNLKLINLSENKLEKPKSRIILKARHLKLD